MMLLKLLMLTPVSRDITVASESKVALSSMLASAVVVSAWAAAEERHFPMETKRRAA